MSDKQGLDYEEQLVGQTTLRVPKELFPLKEGDVITKRGGNKNPDLVSFPGNQRFRLVVADKSVEYAELQGLENEKGISKEVGAQVRKRKKEIIQDIMKSRRLFTYVKVDKKVLQLSRASATRFSEKIAQALRDRPATEAKKASRVEARAKPPDKEPPCAPPALEQKRSAEFQPVTNCSNQSMVQWTNLPSMVPPFNAERHPLCRHIHDAIESFRLRECINQVIHEETMKESCKG